MKAKREAELIKRKQEKAKEQTESILKNQQLALEKKRKEMEIKEELRNEVIF